MAERNGLRLSDEHCKLLHEGTKQAVVRSRKLDVEGRRYVVCSDRAYGVAEFLPPKEITLELFKELRSLHCLTDADRAERWPEAETLWFYRVKSYEPFGEPRELGKAKEFPRDDAGFVDAVVPAMLSEMQDGGIGEVADRLASIWDRHFASTDKITSDGLNREAVLNAALFVLAELEDRNIDAPTGALWEAAKNMQSAKTAAREELEKAAVELPPNVVKTVDELREFLRAGRRGRA